MKSLKHLDVASQPFTDIKRNIQNIMSKASDVAVIVKSIKALRSIIKILTLTINCRTYAKNAIKKEEKHTELNKNVATKRTL